MTMFIIGLFGCLQPSDDFKFRRLDESDCLDKVARVLPKKTNKCFKIAEKMKGFSTAVKNVEEEKTVREMMSSYCQVLNEISESSILIACSLACTNAKNLRGKCTELHLLVGRKNLCQLSSVISTLEDQLAALSRNQPAEFQFSTHDSKKGNKVEKLEAMVEVIHNLHLELRSYSYVIRFLANKKEGRRGKRLSLDLHCCTLKHAWHLAQSAMDKMKVGEELELVTGRGVDSKHSTGPKFRRIREDFQVNFENYAKEKRLAYINLG